MWNASFESRFQLDYECAHCAFQSPVLVMGKGGGGGFDQAGARQRSVDDAGVQAADTLLYIPCPRCGGVDDFGVRYKMEVRLRAALLWLGTTALCVLGGWLKRPRAFESWLAFVIAISAAMAAVVAGAYYAKRRAAWARPRYQFPESVGTGASPS